MLEHPDLDTPLLLLGGHFSSMKDQNAKRRYLNKLHFLGGLDPYEKEKKEWNVDLWPSIAHVNLGMYLFVTPSQYSRKTC